MITLQFIISYIDNLYHSWIFNSHYLLRFQKLAKEKLENGDFIGKDELQAITILEQIFIDDLRSLKTRYQATQFAEKIVHQYRLVVENPNEDYFSEYDVWNADLPENNFYE